MSTIVQKHARDSCVDVQDELGRLEGCVRNNVVIEYWDESWFEVLSKPSTHLSGTPYMAG